MHPADGAVHQAWIGYGYALRGAGVAGRTTDPATARATTAPTTVSLRFTDVPLVGSTHHLIAVPHWATPGPGGPRRHTAPVRLVLPAGGVRTAMTTHTWPVTRAASGHSL